MINLIRRIFEWEKNEQTAEYGVGANTGIKKTLRKRGSIIRDRERRTNPLGHGCRTAPRMIRLAEKKKMDDGLNEDLQDTQSQ